MFGSCENTINTEGYEVRDDGFKHCPYCGSLDPIELTGLIKEGKAVMSGSDWKYGWPHKFYVDIIKDKIVETDKVETIYAKFYSEHLNFVPDESIEEVFKVISDACGILWAKDPKGLRYTSPYHNYQKSP